MIILIPLAIIAGTAGWMLRPYRGMPIERRNAGLLVLSPFLILAIAAILAQWFYTASGNTWVSDIANILYIVGVAIIVAASIVAVYFGLTHKPEIAKGTGFGICLAVFAAIVEMAVLEGVAGV